MKRCQPCWEGVFYAMGLHAAAHHGHIAAETQCTHCVKPATVCVCATVTPRDTRLRVVLLQHPQEQDLLLGTARLAAQCLTQSLLRCGLSWSSLGHVLGEPVAARQWAVVYPKYLPRLLTEAETSASQVLMGPQGEPIKPSAVAGLLLLDGTWSQTKTLWWRNPWLLKMSRLVIQPSEPSMYGRLRREPQRHCLSTLEATADALHGLHEPPEVRLELRRAMRRFLQRLRDASQRSTAAAAAAAAAG